MNFIIRKQSALKPGDLVHIVGRSSGAAKANRIIKDLKFYQTKNVIISNEYSTRIAYMYFYLGNNCFLSASPTNKRKIWKFDLSRDLIHDWVLIFDSSIMNHHNHKQPVYLYD